MGFSPLMLHELKSLIAAGAETHTLLYFVDRMLHLLPKQDRQQQLILQLQQDNAQLQRKIKQAVKENKHLDETLKLVQIELKIRTLKNDKLEREIKKMRYAEARRLKKQQKEETRMGWERISEETLLDQLEKEQEKSDADVTQDGETIQRMVEQTEQFERSTPKCCLGTGCVDHSSSKCFEVDWRDTNPELQCEECEKEREARVQFATVQAALDLAVNIVQSKILNTRSQ